MSSGNSEVFIVANKAYREVSHKLERAMTIPVYFADDVDMSAYTEDIKAMQAIGMPPAVISAAIVGKYNLDKKVAKKIEEYLTAAK
jgi:hypothetical protein